MIYRDIILDLNIVTDGYTGIHIDPFANNGIFTDGHALTDLGVMPDAGTLTDLGFV
jgi:hypothetical protein